MVKIENNNTFNVGDEVWWFDQYGNLQNGKIYDFYNGSMKTGEENDSYAFIIKNSNGIKIGVQLSKCWPSQGECIKAEALRSEEQKEEYKATINDVNDLVKFLWNNRDNSESRDCDAENAAIERAEELLGIKLEL